ncbi:MAG: hypothetical protein WA192_16855 [Candidatus Acidiferrales bacterium]
MAHHDALRGALLGMIEYADRQETRRENRARAAAHAKLLSLPSVWDTRNAAAATTTPKRLEPDPASACPAPTAVPEAAKH